MAILFRLQVLLPLLAWVLLVWRWLALQLQLRPALLRMGTRYRREFSVDLAKGVSIKEGSRNNIGLKAICSKKVDGTK